MLKYLPTHVEIEDYLLSTARPCSLFFQHRSPARSEYDRIKLNFIRVSGCHKQLPSCWHWELSRSRGRPTLRAPTHIAQVREADRLEGNEQPPLILIYAMLGSSTPQIQTEISRNHVKCLLAFPIPLGAVCFAMKSFLFCFCFSRIINHTNHTDLILNWCCVIS